MRQLARARAIKALRRSKGDGACVIPLEEAEEARGESSVEEGEVTDRELPKELLKRHVQEWVSALPRADVQSLSILLHYTLVEKCDMKLTAASDVIGEVLEKSSRTVRQWRADFISNDGSFSDSQKGRYQRQGLLWRNEELNKKATEYMIRSTSNEGQPSTSAVDFHHWVNVELLPSAVLGPEYPRYISSTTANRWLHELGFRVFDKRNVSTCNAEKTTQLESTSEVYK